MKIQPTGIAGVFLIDLELLSDERGFFARTFCREEFERAGLDPAVVQCNLSYNRKRGTVRGLHWQAAPHGEAKLVRCVRGAIFDVAVDVRDESSMRGRHVAVELSAENRRALYIAAGLAHGFQTLTDDAEIFYQMSAAYHGPSGRGLHYASSRLGIAWPLAVTMVSMKDEALPAFG